MKALICALFTSVSLASAMEPDPTLARQRHPEVQAVVPFEQELEQCGCRGKFKNISTDIKQCLVNLWINDDTVQIPAYLCECCSSLRKINFLNLWQPFGLRRIGQSAFFSCSSLQSLHVPISVEHIGAYAFRGCINLSRVTFYHESELVVLGEGSFKCCKNLTEIYIPPKVEKIKASCFQKCINLNSITFENESRLRVLGEQAFAGCLLKTPVRIPDSVQHIGNACFQTRSDDGDFEIVISEHSELQSIGGSILDPFIDILAMKIPALVASRVGLHIVDQAIANSEPFQQKLDQGIVDAEFLSLAFPELPNMTTFVSNMYFNRGLLRGSLEKLIVPKTVTKVSDFCFYYWELGEVTFEDETKIEELGKYAFYGNNMTIMRIPNSLKRIGAHCFDDCAFLCLVTIRCNTQLEYIGDGAFAKTNQGAGTQLIVSSEAEDRILNILAEYYPNFDVDKYLTNLPGETAEHLLELLS